MLLFFTKLKLRAHTVLHRCYSRFSELNLITKFVEFDKFKQVFSTDITSVILHLLILICFA